ncbi:hypothetical protein DERF_003494 [Dermatophagoides farinae]|uniref:Uncharacterized protein n=1 Tax=Dermatophagoides farinae TaxID=6954 RepID=A0A922IET9_DERFA|nr:hypothetical protein DERF_003494 [Dermatophagoides farinae]
MNCVYWILSISYGILKIEIGQNLSYTQTPLYIAANYDGSGRSVGSSLACYQILSEDYIEYSIQITTTTTKIKTDRHG